MVNSGLKGINARYAMYLKKNNTNIVPQLQGKVEKVDDLELYFVGTGSKCLIWNYDIFGFDSGRTRQTADLFAEAGYLVIIPDFYRGTHREPTAPDVVQWIQEVTNWSKLKRTFEDIVMPFARAKGQEY